MRKRSSPTAKQVRFSWTAAAALALLTLVVFLPILRNGFLTWDDNNNFTENPLFQSLSWESFRWAWSARVLAVYQPLSWILLEVEKSIWGMEPWGYHLTSILLHTLNVVIVYWLLTIFLARTRKDRWSLEVSALLAAAFWAVHPLRTEAVAWASCQPYLPSCTFFLLSIAAYLKSASSPEQHRRWLFLSWLAFLVALLFKAVAMSLTVVLLLIDVYWLGRTTRSAIRKALIEKIPFAFLTVISMAIARYCHAEYRRTTADAYPSFAEGVAQAAYGLIVSLRRIVLPFDLTGFYPIPYGGFFQPRFLVCVLLVFAITALAVFFRKRAAVVGMAWFTQIIILAPNLGLFEFNSALTADRYTYFSSLGWTLALAFGISWWIQEGNRKAVGAALGTILVGWVLFTLHLSGIWHDTVTFWKHVLGHGGEMSSFVRSNLGVALAEAGDTAQGEAELLKAIELSPTFANAHDNLANLYYRQGKFEPALEEFRKAVSSQPNDPRFRKNLVAVLLNQGDFKEAEANARTALEARPQDEELQRMLDYALKMEGKKQ